MENGEYCKTFCYFCIDQKGKAECYCVWIIVAPLQPSSPPSLRRITAPNPPSLFLMWYHTNSDRERGTEPQMLCVTQRFHNYTSKPEACCEWHKDVSLSVCVCVCLFVPVPWRGPGTSKANYADKRGIKEAANEWRLFVFALQKRQTDGVTELEACRTFFF